MDQAFTTHTFTSSTLHSGGMRCYTSFCPSAATIATDIPATKGGRGQYPSPADMLAASVASCMLSMIAYTAARSNQNAEGISIRAACQEGAGGISAIELDIIVPVRVPEARRKVLEAAARACPVGNAIHPDVAKKITWHWSD